MPCHWKSSLWCHDFLEILAHATSVLHVRPGTHYSVRALWRVQFVLNTDLPVLTFISFTLYSNIHIVACFSLISQYHRQSSFLLLLSGFLCLAGTDNVFSDISVSAQLSELPGDPRYAATTLTATADEFSCLSKTDFLCTAVLDCILQSTALPQDDSVDNTIPPAMIASYGCATWISSSNYTVSLPRNFFSTTAQ